MFRKTLLIAPLLLGLSACANMNTIENSSEPGASQIFNHPADTVSSAALESVQSLNVAVKKTENQGDTFEIYFSKPVSAWSWGEVGRVTVRPLEENATVVEVRAEKRHQLQVTGTDELEFAGAIFSGIEKRLNR